MGRQDVVETLARERGPALVGYAYLLTGDLATAQDVVQDALVHTFVRFRSGRDPRHAEARLAGPGEPSSDDVEVEHVDVQRALAVLSPRERVCVVLRHFEDLSVREVAESLRLSDGAVERYLSDARARLGELLADESEEYWPVRPSRPAARRAR
jgi:RNA polymerase sigma-70 factor (ECF subfamily)